MSLCLWWRRAKFELCQFHLFSSMCGPASVTQSQFSNHCENKEVPALTALTFIPMRAKRPTSIQRVKLTIAEGHPQPHPLPLAYLPSVGPLRSGAISLTLWTLVLFVLYSLPSLKKPSLWTEDFSTSENDNKTPQMSFPSSADLKQQE